MRITLIGISVILMCVLLTRSRDLWTLVSQTPSLESSIREHTWNYEVAYSKSKQLVKQRLHTKDPQSPEYLQTVKILHDLDSLYRRYSYSPDGLVQVVEHLKTFSEYSSRFTVVDLQLPDNLFSSPNQRLWCEYYKAKFLSAFMEALLKSTQRSDCMCLDKFSFFQVYNPVSKDYQVHFGSFGGCSDIYHHIRVNDQVARHGEFSYTPMQVGIDSLLIEIERFDAKANVVVQDTFYYPIEIVESDMEVRS